MNIEKNNPIASISSRLKAFLTDTFLITTPILYITIYLLFGSGEEFANNRALGWLIILIIHMSVIVIFWVFKAQTPGLKAYDLKVVNKKNENISFIQAFIRYFITLFCVITIFANFFIFFIKHKKCLQDILSNTLIVEDNSNID